MATAQIQPRVGFSADTSDITGSYRVVRGWRDGTISTTDFLQAMIGSGRGFGAQMGSASTALTFLTYAANRPDVWIRVPSGTIAVPFFAFVASETRTGTLTNIDFRITANDIGNGTSTAATVGPLNLSPNNTQGYTSLVTPRQLATGDTTTETSPLSLYRKAFPLASATTADADGNVVWPALDKSALPMLIGPATFEVYISATTNQVTGYAGIQWIELPSTFLT